MPPCVLMRWTVVTPDSTPVPRRSVASSLSHGMSFGLAPGASRHLAHHRAAVAVLPAWPRVVPANRLAVEKERRDRLAELPRELAARIGLALVDLSPLRMERRDDGLPRRGNGVWPLRGYRACQRRQRDDRNRQQRCPSMHLHGSPPSSELPSRPQYLTAEHGSAGRRTVGRTRPAPLAAGASVQRWFQGSPWTEIRMLR